MSLPGCAYCARPAKRVRRAHCDGSSHGASGASVVPRPRTGASPRLPACQVACSAGERGLFFCLLPARRAATAGRAPQGGRSGDASWERSGRGGGCARAGAPRRAQRDAERTPFQEAACATRAAAPRAVPIRRLPATHACRLGEHATAKGAGAATVPQRRGAGENAHAPKSAKSAHASQTLRCKQSARRSSQRAARTFGFGQCLHAKASRMCTVRALNSHPVRHVCLETSVSTPVSRLALRHVGAASGSSMYSRVSAWHLCGICNALSLLLREHGGVFRNYRQGRLLTAPLVSLRWHDAAARSSWSPAQATDRCESGDAGAPRSASCVQQQWHAAGRGEAGDAGDEVFQVVHAGKAGEATVWPTRADAARWRGAPLSTVLRLWRARAA